MIPKPIKKNIYWVGYIDWDRRVFDSLIPTPHGTTYNSYLIKGSEKSVLIETVDFGKEDYLIKTLQMAGIENLDYIIANHAEQDHTGSLPKILDAYPKAKVVTNSKCKDLLQSFLMLPEDKFIVVKDNDEISLGDKTIQFMIAPWVHWPDTMFTYLKEDKILFTCDFLGSHYATSALFVLDEREVYLSAKRYYAEIMMPFRTNVVKHLQRIENLQIEIIAPSHGPLYNVHLSLPPQGLVKHSVKDGLLSICLDAWRQKAMVEYLSSLKQKVCKTLQSWLQMLASY